MTKQEERNQRQIYDSASPYCIFPSDGENSDKIERNSKRWKPTRLEGEKPKDLAELIYRMIDGERTFIEGNTLPQCGKKRLRSIEDIFRIAKYYKPSITLSEVHKGVKSLYSDCVTYSYCCTVHRFVHRKKNVTKTVNDYRTSIGSNNIKFGKSKNSN